MKGSGLHALDLFEFSLRECRLSGGFDHVWVAYDRDNFDPQDFDSVEKRCATESTGATKYHALWSNPCAEVWILLHFYYTTAEMTSSEAILRVDSVFRKELGRSYRKNDERLFEILASRTKEADKNAARLSE